MPEDKEKKPEEIDLKSILLPKKEVHDPTNASRVNAGELLKQETTAKLPVQKTTQGPPPPKQEESVVQALETYQGDIEKLVQKKNVSVVSIAAAEAARRSAEPPEDISRTPGHESSHFVRNLGLFVGGLLFFIAALGLFGYVYVRTLPLETTQTDEYVPFISVDATQIVVFGPSDLTRASIMNTLESIRRGAALELGLVGRFYLAESQNQNEVEAYDPISLERLFSVLAPSAPGELRRTLTGVYLVGVHSFEDNQAFFIAEVDSYGQAFSGMLAWEHAMQNDLSPLFSREPRPLTAQEALLRATLSTTTVRSTASNFTDAVVENYDSRVLYDAYGNIILLWTMLDRSTLLITTNEFTLREILSRFTTSPVTIEK